MKWWAFRYLGHKSSSICHDRLLRVDGYDVAFICHLDTRQFWLVRSYTALRPRLRLPDKRNDSRSHPRSLVQVRNVLEAMFSLSPRLLHSSDPPPASRHSIFLGLGIHSVRFLAWYSIDGRVTVRVKLLSVMQVALIGAEIAGCKLVWEVDVSRL